MAGAHHLPERLTASAVVPVAGHRDRRTAAAQVVNMDEYAAQKRHGATINGESAEQREAWVAYDKIPEVGTLVDGTANLLAQCRMTIGRREWSNGQEVDRQARLEDGSVDPVFDPGVVAEAEDALARYVDDSGSQAGLLRPMFQNYQVPGEGRMVGYYVDNQGKPTTKSDNERWVFVSPGAIAKVNDREDDRRYKLRVTRTLELDLPTAIVHRFSWPHPRYPGESAGWVIRSLDVCRDLRSFTMGLRSAARSGIPADLFLIPTEASPRTVQSIDWGDEEGNVVTAQDATDEWATKVEDLVHDYVMGVMEDTNAGNTVTPGVLAVEGRFIEFFTKMSFSRMVDRGIGELVRDGRLRLASAAECAPEMLKGLGATNRWNGAQVADDEYRRYYKPKADGGSDQWTAKLVWADLKARGMKPEMFRTVRVIVDSSAVTADPDYSKIVPGALDRFVIGPSGARKLLRIPEWAAPTDEEKAFMKEIKMKPPTAGKGQGDTGPPDGDSEVDESKGSVKHQVKMKSVIKATRNSVGDDLADRLAVVEATTRARLEEACEAALDRALDTGGAKLRNWARKAGGDLKVIADSPGARDVITMASLIGPEQMIRLADNNVSLDEQRRREELFAAALVALVARWKGIAAGAFAAALIIAGQTIPQEEIDAAVERSADVLRDSMLLLADAILFGKPGTPAPTVGEISRLRIPSPLINRVLAVAGGALGVGPGIVATVEAALGLVFGPLLDRVLPAKLGLRWVYGDPAERTQPYLEHEALDQQTFTNAYDERLSGSPFAPTFFPGDHDGCRCVWVPVYDQS